MSGAITPSLSISRSLSSLDGSSVFMFASAFLLFLLPWYFLPIYFYEQQVVFYPPCSPPTPSGSAFPRCAEARVLLTHFHEGTKLAHFAGVHSPAAAGGGGLTPGPGAASA